MRLPSISRMPAHGRERRRTGLQAGFAYIGLMIAVAVTGVLLASAGEVWRLAVKREKEKELLFAGNQFRQALASYYARSPAQERRYPMRLEELLEDPRTPGTRRHLRRIYVDPMTGGTEWGAIRGPDGEIFGVHSLSGEAPLKKGNFGQANRNFAAAETYADWVFMHAPGQYSTQPVRSAY